jgi:hypothetical protein
LVENGQWEFLSGGISSPDEALPHYEDLIENYNRGVQFLREELRVKRLPRASFLLDSFGHSLTNAWVSKKLGMHYLISSRIDFEDKANRERDQALKINWQLPFFKEDNGIMFEVYPGHYFEPFHTDRHQYRAKVAGQLSEIVAYTIWPSSSLGSLACNMASAFWAIQDSYFASVHMRMLGKDFGWGGDQKDHFQFLDRMRLYANQNLDLEIVWSSIGDYLKDWSQYYSLSDLPTKRQDFFPYRDRPGSSWGAYFTTKPIAKEMPFRLGRVFQQYRQMSILYLRSGVASSLDWQQFHDSFRKVSFELGVLIHHDAITGTNKPKVMKDYIKRFKSTMTHL